MTRFDTKTHPLIKLQWTAKIYNPDDIDNIINAAVQVQEAMEKDDKIAFLLNFNNGVIVAFLLYADWSSDLDAAFDPLLKLSSLITTAIPKGRGTLLDFTGVFVEREGVSRYVATQNTKHRNATYAPLDDTSLLQVHLSLRKVIGTFLTFGSKQRNPFLQKLTFTTLCSHLEAPGWRLVDETEAIRSAYKRYHSPVCYLSP